VGKQLFIEQNNVRQDSTYPARVKKKYKLHLNVLCDATFINPTVVCVV
jgi:hypothetical protein